MRTLDNHTTPKNLVGSARKYLHPQVPSTASVTAITTGGRLRRVEAARSTVCIVPHTHTHRVRCNSPGSARVRNPQAGGRRSVYNPVPLQCFSFGSFSPQKEEIKDRKHRNQRAIGTAGIYWWRGSVKSFYRRRHFILQCPGVGEGGGRWFGTVGLFSLTHSLALEVATIDYHDGRLSGQKLRGSTIKHCCTIHMFIVPVISKPVYFFFWAVRGGGVQASVQEPCFRSQLT